MDEALKIPTEDGLIRPLKSTGLSAADFARLEAIPPEVEWFAHLANANTRRAYQSDVREFMAFLGIAQAEELRRVGRAHVLAWRSRIQVRGPSGKCDNAATVRRKLAAVSSLYQYLCDQNAVAANPVSGVSRPKEGANRGKTPAISSRQGSALLKAPSGESLQAKRDRAILAVFLYHGLRVGEVAALKVGDLFQIEEVLHWRVRGKGRSHPRSRGPSSRRGGRSRVLELRRAWRGFRRPVVSRLA